MRRLNIVQPLTRRLLVRRPANSAGPEAATGTVQGHRPPRPAAVGGGSKTGRREIEGTPPLGAGPAIPAV